MMAGRIESRMQHYMPATMTDAVMGDLASADGSMQHPADDVILSSATKRAMLLSRIHSRCFRE